MAVPFSMGRNLFCIYSKKYMENPPEQKPAKQMHNMRTLKKMADMLVSAYFKLKLHLKHSV
jgi:glycerol-3-phosphate O-acyltransferase